jgi:leader peptidase (prepilin peptidase) / N-methyltransferase
VDFAIAAPFGLLIGSFLNVVAYRLPRGQSLVKPRSRCTYCDQEVRPYDNVPVLSWLLLRGRCRFCSQKISARYPVIEALTGLVFGAVVVARGFDRGLVLDLPFAAMLIAVASIDLELRIVPNKILLPMAVWGVGAAALVRPDALPESLIAGAAAFTALLLAALAYPGGMGMGDVKLAGVMGIYLGAAVAPALLIAFLLGSLVGVAIMARDGAAGRKKGVPFAPFMALGGLGGLLFGTQLINLYVQHFL